MRVAIVEDETESAELLQNYLNRYSREHGEVFETTVFCDGDEFMLHYRPVYDVVFMDIEMPKVDGMKAARYLRESDKSVCLVFVTNMAQYALKGYEVNAFDFVVKPVRYTDFAYRLKKVGEVVRSRQNNEAVLAFGKERRRVNVSEIYYVSVDKHNVVYHTAHGEIKASESLIKSEKALSKHNFTRCNSGFLVNLDHVREIRKNEVNVAGEWLLISRPRKKSFMEALTIYLGGGGL